MRFALGFACLTSDDLGFNPAPSVPGANLFTGSLDSRYARPAAVPQNLSMRRNPAFLF